MSNIVKDNSNSNIQKKRRTNYAAVINTTESGKNYKVDIKGLSETELQGGQDEVLPSPPAPDTIVTITKKNEIVKVNTDSKDILSSIRQHLDKFNKVDDLSLGKNINVLTIGENKITVECLLHKMGNDKDFLPNVGNQCTNAIKNYQDNGLLDLNKLIKLSNNFKQDSDFYDNLYGFDIALVNFITNNADFKKSKPNTKASIINGAQKFIRQSLDYLSEFMSKHQIINDKLISSSYDLLYLMNKLTLQRITVGPNVSSLGTLYERLVETAKNNISLFHQINVPSISKQVGVEQIVIPEVDTMRKELESRIAILEKEHTNLETNVRRINENTSNLENLITPNVKNML